MKYHQRGERDAAGKIYRNNRNNLFDFSQSSRYNRHILNDHPPKERFFPLASGAVMLLNVRNFLRKLSILPPF